MNCSRLEDLCGMPSPAPEPEPAPEPAPEPEPAPRPSPAPAPAPVSGCQKFCGQTDLRLTNKWCNVKKSDEDCLNSFLLQGKTATPCKWTGTKCKADRDNKLD